MFAGLQDLGVANGEDLKETLTNCTEPLKAIEQFQVLVTGPSVALLLGATPDGAQGDLGDVGGTLVDCKANALQPLL